MTVMAPHLASDGTAAVPPPPTPLTPAGASCDVGAAIAAMATAVQCGDFAGAEALGAAAPLHLALPKHAVLNLQPLSLGAQAAVFTADLAPDCAHLLPGLALPASHTGGGLTVAVKRAHIRDSAGRWLKGGGRCWVALPARELILLDVQRSVLITLQSTLQHNTYTFSPQHTSTAQP